MHSEVYLLCSIMLPGTIMLFLPLPAYYAKSICSILCMSLTLGKQTAEEVPVGRRYDDIQMSHDKYRLHDDIIAYFTFRA